ncbi:hypothetical protein [Mannheimia haemolytica]|uniref:hypothetical protein n=1 Tax=Mannheimia haemolytica TaxID=75985 RepID=UPI001EFF3C03|nr:hypothetical protein [Mannheimia haemolytica]
MVDKTKTTDDCSRELIDCAGGQIQQICADKWKIRPDHWESIQPPPPPQEEIKPLELEAFAREQAIERIVGEVRLSKLIAEFLNQNYAALLTHLLMIFALRCRRRRLYEQHNKIHLWIYLLRH